MSGIDVQSSLLLVSRVTLGLFFVTAGIAKVSNLTGFAAGVADYQILSERQARLVGFALPWVEAALGIVLIVGVAVPTAGVIAMVLLATFTVAVGVNLWRGREIPCNCFGMAGTATAGIGTVMRNVLLLALSGSTVALGLQSARGLTISFEPALLMASLVAWCVALVHLVEATVDGHVRSSRLGRID